ncbi:MAG: DnaJ domain-containing protein [Lentisphaeria bacterium]|nr:DnaJ domain-containing protein [Lentisphaeria bacterium]MDY0175752.1 DnaJ domain-containing protein [Lentisphaeria bacterium]NLZ59923.1 DnaJ domain-containing protein [Lentisphaerota bacterium]
MKYPYDVLNLPENAGQNEIRQAYLRLLKENPPEKNGGRFQEINEAYELVKNELERARLAVFGIPKTNQKSLKISELLIEKPVQTKRAGVEFWLKQLRSEPNND